jgi:hypothetical protein
LVDNYGCSRLVCYLFCILFLHCQHHGACGMVKCDGQKLWPVPSSSSGACSIYKKRLFWFIGGCISWAFACIGAGVLWWLLVGRLCTVDALVFGVWAFLDNCSHFLGQSNCTRIGPVLSLIGTCAGLVSVGYSTWWRSSELFFHIQVVGRASSVWSLESNAVIWAVLALMVLFSIHMQVSLILWLSGSLAKLSASAESKISFTRAVYLFKATVCFSFTLLLPYTLLIPCQSLCAYHFALRVHADRVCLVPWRTVLWLALAWIIEAFTPLFLYPLAFKTKVDILLSFAFLTKSRSGCFCPWQRRVWTQYHLHQEEAEKLSKVHPYVDLVPQPQSAASGQSIESIPCSFQCKAFILHDNKPGKGIGNVLRLWCLL